MAKGDQPQSILDRLFRRHRSDDASEDADVGSGDATDDSVGEGSDIVGEGASDDAPVGSGDSADEAAGPIPDPVDVSGARATQDPTLARIFDGDDVATIEPPPESSLARDSGLLDEASPQLDADLVEARLGGKGPQPPDPDGPPDDAGLDHVGLVDEAGPELVLTGDAALINEASPQLDSDGASDDLAFGKGAADAPDVAQIDASDQFSVTDDVRAFRDADAFDDVQLVDFAEGVDDSVDDGTDPVAAQPPGGDQASHEIQIDDTTDHSDPTEVDID